jgi:hypothetical protein
MGKGLKPEAESLRGCDVPVKNRYWRGHTETLPTSSMAVKRLLRTLFQPPKELLRRSCSPSGIHADEGSCLPEPRNSIS